MKVLAFFVVLAFQLLAPVAARPPPTTPTPTPAPETTTVPDPMVRELTFLERVGYPWWSRYTCVNETYTRPDALAHVSPEFIQNVKRMFFFNDTTKQYYQKEMLRGVEYHRDVFFVLDICSGSIWYELAKFATPVLLNDTQVSGFSATSTQATLTTEDTPTTTSTTVPAVTSTPILATSTQVTLTEATPSTTVPVVNSTQAMPISPMVYPIFTDAELEELELPTNEGPGLDRPTIELLKRARVASNEYMALKFETPEQAKAWIAPENVEKRNLVLLAQEVVKCFYAVRNLANWQICVKDTISRQKMKP